MTSWYSKVLYFFILQGRPSAVALRLRNQTSQSSPPFRKGWVSRSPAGLYRKQTREGPTDSFVMLAPGETCERHLARLPHRPRFRLFFR